MDQTQTAAESLGFISFKARSFFRSVAASTDYDLHLTVRRLCPLAPRDSFVYFPYWQESQPIEQTNTPLLCVF